VRNGMSARRAPQSGAFDVVLTSVAMLGGDGVETLRAVRRSALDVPVVLVTGSPSVDSALQALGRSLVADLDREPIKRKLVASIASIRRDLGIAVVAEGIETCGERDLIVEAGCDLQGFLFRRPGELRLEDGFTPGGEEGAWMSQLGS
jgi:CheY-like chemotaxis protein